MGIARMLVVPKRRVVSARSTHPQKSIQREYEQVARVLQLVELHGMQVAAAGLHRQILLRSDRISNGRALERRAEIEAPELLQCLVVIGDHPAVLQRRE